MRPLSFPFYGHSFEELPDSRFAGGSGLRWVSIAENGQYASTRLGRAGWSTSLRQNEDESNIGPVELYHFDDHAYSTGTWIKNAIGLSKEEFCSLLTTYDISPAFLAHLFGQGLAVGSRVVTTPRAAKDEAVQHVRSPTNDVPVDAEARKRAEFQAEDHAGLHGTINETQKYHHVWYTINAGSSIRNIEVYSRVLIPKGNLTIFALRLPSAILRGLDDPRITSSWVEEPFRFHVHLVEIALKSWDADYGTDMNLINDTEASTYHARSEKLSSDRIILLHAHLRTLQRQSLKIGQLAMCIPRLLNVFEVYKGFMLDAKRHVDLQVAQDLEYLAHQARALENKYADAKKRLELLLQLNYYLMNDKATQVSQDMAKISIDDNRFMKMITEQSKRIAEDAKKDSAAMKALTVVAVLAIPTTVVSSICGTNFIAYDGAANKVHTSAWIWIVFVVSICTSLLISFVWWLWDPELGKLSLRKIQLLGKRTLP